MYLSALEGWLIADKHEHIDEIALGKGA